MEADRWDGPLRTLSTDDQAASILRCYGMGDATARDVVAALALPLTLTMRGCVVYATKGGAVAGPQGRSS